MSENRTSPENEVALVNGLNVSQLVGVVQAVNANPSLGRTLWRARTKWNGGFQVQASIRDFTVGLDEPKDLGGTDTAPNPVEVILGAYGACLTIGYVMNAAVRGIEIQKLEIELDGDIDLPGFLGLEIPGLEALPGFTNIRAKVFIKSTAPLEDLEKLSRDVTRTSPVGLTLSKPVNLSVELVQRRFV
ncbi:MAG: OsmC family protein [Chloroflexi bacterium]|nr:OsmC family protein [Chloroflexota bacterium]